MSARIRPAPDQLTLTFDDAPVADASATADVRATAEVRPAAEVRATADASATAEVRPAAEVRAAREGTAGPASMLPGDGSEPFDDDRWFFEPWWPGVSATLVIESGGVQILSQQFTDPMPAFPELLAVARQVRASEAVIPGTLMVLDADGRPDPAALRRRLADPDDRDGTGAFIAADLLARDRRSLADLPFAERRANLLEVIVDGDRFLASRGLRGEGVTLATAAASMGIEHVSARRVDAPWRSGVAAEAWLRLPVSGRPVGPVRPLLVLLQRLPFD